MKMCALALSPHSTKPALAHSLLAHRLNKDAGLLTNLDVAWLLEERMAQQQQRQRRGEQHGSLLEFEAAVLRYIRAHATPALLADRAAAERYVRALRARGLAPLEVVQATNFQPNSEVDVHAVRPALFLGFFFSPSHTNTHTHTDRSVGQHPGCSRSIHGPCPRAR